MNDGALSKRAFLRKVFAGVAGTTLLPAVAKAAGTEPGAPSETVPPQTVSENHILRMTADVTRALGKPVDKRRWGMVIDLKKCVGCSACTINCAVENALPPGVVYRPVLEEELGTYPRVARRFVPRPCMQCDNPPCTPVCPVGATFKRPDGIVAIDYDQCIGCRYCLTACPYSSRTSDFGDFFTEGVGVDPKALEPYEKRDTLEYHERRNRSKHESPVGNARKCTFCVHRTENGMLPSCVTTCIGHATFFGDLADPKSLVAELSVSPRVMCLKEELGTKPKVFYLT